jgi:hypothetical protein
MKCYRIRATRSRGFKDKDSQQGEGSRSLHQRSPGASKGATANMVATSVEGHRQTKTKNVDSSER